jgi:hypothetical protein
LQYLESCKIKRINNLFFAISGLTKSVSYNFDPYKIAEEQFILPDDFNSKISSFKVVVEKQLLDILPKIKSNPESWQMVVTKERRVLDIGIIGNINGQLGVFRLGFIVNDQQSLAIEVQEEFIACTQSTDKYIGFGDSDTSRKYIITHLKAEPPEKVVFNSIKAQSLATPLTVGGPLNLLRVKVNSFEWIFNRTCND